VTIECRWRPGQAARRIRQPVSLRFWLTSDLTAKARMAIATRSLSLVVGSNVRLNAFALMLTMMLILDPLAAG